MWRKSFYLTPQEKNIFPHQNMTYNLTLFLLITGQNYANIIINKYYLEIVKDVTNEIVH